MILGIFGASGLGREILETVRAINKENRQFEQVFFVDDNPGLNVVQGVKVYRLQAAYENFGDAINLVLAVGEPSTRRKIIKRVEEMGLSFISIVHPSVKIPESTKIGAGCYVAPYVFISCNVEIGDYTLIQPHAGVGHDCKIGSNVIISSMVALSGNVHIGDDTYIGVNVSAIQNCSIGKNSILGMGSVVVRDIPDDVIAMGNPARPMKKNEEQRVFK